MNYPWLKSIAFSNPPQALCIAGVPGLGQATLAEHFAQGLLGQSQFAPHADCLIISPEPGKSIGIDLVREITEFCLIAPTRASRKVVLMHAADSMTLPAQQAFLKTLEEPVVTTTFILLTSQVNKLLPTLRSRCQMIMLASVPYQQAKIWFDQEKMSVTPEAYTLTDGAPLMVLQAEFQDRQTAYSLMNETIHKKSISADTLKSLVRAEPLDVLTGFYYALMHQQKFTELDACIALRKKYSDNANLNWEMQLNSFLIEVQRHAV